MKKLLLPVFLVMVLASCTNTNNQETKSPEVVALPETTIPLVLLEKGCYAYQDGKNVVNFEITDVNGSIKGNLTFDFFEKDKNTGTFDGQLDGNHLFGQYTFMSEGIESAREIAFIIQNGQLIEGYGELNSEGNAFKNKSEILYSSEMPLSKIDCDKVAL